MIRSFVRAQGSVTIENVLDHMDHVVKLAGDRACRDRNRRRSGRTGRTPVPSKKADLDGIDYEKKIFDLAEGLLRRNYRRQDIELILGGNFQRVLSQIWAA